MPVVSALVIVSCLYVPLACFNIAIKTVKNIIFAYCFLFLVCVIRARFIYTSKILLADRMQSKIFENNRYLIKFY